MIGLKYLVTGKFYTGVGRFAGNAKIIVRNIKTNRTNKKLLIVSSRNRTATIEYFDFTKSRERFRFKIEKRKSSIKRYLDKQRAYKSSRFTRKEFYKFCNEKDLETVTISNEFDVEVLKDANGNYYSFKKFPNNPSEEIYAILLLSIQ